MIKRSFFIGFIVISLLVSQSMFVHASTLFKGVSARNAVLMEQSTGRVLYGKLVDSPQLIASITKIMTAILAIESGKLQDTVTVSANALKTEGSSIYLQVGQKVKLEELVYGLMLRSGNDAANVIAEYVGGSIDGFIYMMNQKAEEIGMKHTVFSNPSGLEQKGKEHYSTAYDMALLTRYAMQNATYAKIAGTKSYRPAFLDYDWKNKNKLLTQLYPYSTGGKTGFTKKAGRTLVSTASKNGMNLIVVTLSAGDDWNDHMYLFNTAFDNYKMENVLQKGILEEVKDGGYSYVKNDFMYPLTQKEKESVTKKITYYPKVKDDGKMGVITLYLGDEEIGQRNLFYTKNKTIVAATFFIQKVGMILMHMIGVGIDG